MQQRVGRPMKAVSDPTNAKGKLAAYLRDGRRKNGLSRAEIAMKIECSDSTIQRAEAGKTPPTLTVVQGYARICGLDPVEAESLWRAARRSQNGGARRSLTQAPRLNLVRNEEDLGAALVRTYEENDKPSARVMEHRAEQRYLESREFAPLSRSTAWRIATRQTLPTSVENLQAFLFAIEVPEKNFPEWIKAWNRVRERARRGETRRRKAAEAAERRARRPTAAEAEQQMRAAGLEPAEKYPGARVPWAAYCNRCKSLSRFRLSDVQDAGVSCRACQGTEWGPTLPGPR